MVGLVSDPPLMRVVPVICSFTGFLHGGVGMVQRASLVLVGGSELGIGPAVVFVDEADVLGGLDFDAVELGGACYLGDATAIVGGGHHEALSAFAWYISLHKDRCFRPASAATRPIDQIRTATAVSSHSSHLRCRRVVHRRRVDYW